MKSAQVKKESPMPKTAAKYKRVLLKMSGEVLMGDRDYGIDPKTINRLAPIFSSSSMTA